MLQRIGLTNAEALEALQRIDGIMTQVEDGRWLSVIHDEIGDNPLKNLDIRFLSTSKKYFTDEQYKSIEDKEGEIFYIPDDFADCDDIEDFLTKNDYLYIKVWCYDHGGLSLSRGCFCQWDSYPFGFLYLHKSQVRQIFGVKNLTKKVLAQAEAYFESVLKDFDYYVKGEQYNVQIFNSPNLDDIVDGIYIVGYSNLCDYLEQELSNKKSA